MFHSKGLGILAFPSNDFGVQVPGDYECEREYAQRKFGLRGLTVFDHVHVNGEGSHDVFAFLKDK